MDDCTQFYCYEACSLNTMCWGVAYVATPTHLALEHNTNGRALVLD